MRDLISDIKIENAITSQTISTQTTTYGETIDRTGFDSVSFGLKVETYTDGNFTLVVQDSDDGSTWTNVDSAFVIGTPTALIAVGVDKLGYVGGKRYSRIGVVSVNETAAVNAVLSAIAVLGHARHNKVS